MSSLPYAHSPSFQEIIQRFHRYWTAQGCTIWQPHSEKVGAGTMNPATVLRVLGPEPWHVAYVEPSFRPDDGRYAENPNRMQMHTQYQVILKPDPGNSQELYLGSLEAIGLDRTRHDIRFVEDNWESPALGAWGLGWEVWLDGQEITQFTYFQQAGGHVLDPISVEITYGLERIAMYLQQKGDVWSIDFDGRHTYGEIYRRQEVEHCIYDFELADIKRQKLLFEIFQAEAEASIARGLAAPAHDFILRQSHAFNILDTRGAIGVTERAKFFATMRSQARAVAEIYAQQRLREEYPWMPEGEGGQATPNPSFRHTQALPAVTTPQDFLLELGSEELPAHDVVAGIDQIRTGLTRLLGRQRLPYADLQVSGTPRRLVAYVTGVAPAQLDETVEKKGPPAERAYNSDGTPTKAAVGFAKGQGVPVAQLTIRDNYVYAMQRVEGRPTLAVLPEILAELLDGLRWGKTMRWNATNQTYPRPLRWILTLYGPHPVPFTWAGVASGRDSRAPRFAEAAARLAPGASLSFAVAHAQEYLAAVAAQGVVLDRTERRRLIVTQVAHAADQVGGEAPHDPDLLDEVTDLVESPQALLGAFEPKYLSLPQPILIAVMKKHQRYFPIVPKQSGRQVDDQDGPDHRGGATLLPYFVTVANSNGLAHPEVVKAGNEGVIRARYADADFFYRQDMGRPLRSFTPRLATLTFHEDLGSMLDKVQRLTQLSVEIGGMIEVTPPEITLAKRAAALCKSDLVTHIVVEMTGLQGIMGEIYALASGEPPPVAQAIREHYLPRFAGDAIPASRPGLILSLADKLDSLAGLFGAGVTPSGSTDPFGLRRAALGILSILLTSQMDMDVYAALAQAATLQPIAISEVALVEARTFLQRRLQGVLLESGLAFDVVEAVLAVRSANPAAALRAAQALAQAIGQPWWKEAFTAYARCARIVRNLDAALPLQPALYQDPAEDALHAAYEHAAGRISTAAEPAHELGGVLRELQAPVDAYFSAVLVNADDTGLRQARLALVQHVARLPQSVADLSTLQGF